MWRPVIQKIKNKILFLGTHWLNIAGKSTLIQSILSAYPIYISSMVLSPNIITNNISMEIRKFLWQGGKVQSKKFHLVKWDVVKTPKLNEGLGIRVPEQMNKALGAKLVWRMVSGSKDWWKEVIGKKYIRKPHSTVIYHTWDGQGTSIWQPANIL